MGAQLLTQNDKPVLLMSATCRPVAIEATKKSLKLGNHNLKVVSGELTRPEIRIIRREVSTSVASARDLFEIFGLKSETPDDLVVPTLIYSGSGNRTLQAMKVITAARVGSAVPSRVLKANSTLIRRFHSCTGNSDKISVVDDFANEVFPVVSCTMALGMGKNWSRVRRVIHIGRGDPSAICQMIGRCGRDGRPGLAIFYVEKRRP
jgi:superfamily II DNA helicase RecQ